MRKADRGSAGAVGNPDHPIQFCYQRPLTDINFCKPVEERTTSDLTVKAGLISLPASILRATGSVFASERSKPVRFNDIGGVMLEDYEAPVFDTRAISAHAGIDQRCHSHGGASRRRSLAGSVAQTAAGLSSPI